MQTIYMTKVILVPSNSYLNRDNDGHEEVTMRSLYIEILWFGQKNQENIYIYIYIYIYEVYMKVIFHIVSL